MSTFLDQLFTSQLDATRRDLQGFNTQAVGDAMRITNAAANRGAANPQALATASANATARQRAEMAGQQSQMLAAARQADQNRAGQFVGGLLNTAGAIGGMALNTVAPGAGNVVQGGAGMLASKLGSPAQTPAPLGATGTPRTPGPPPGGYAAQLGSPTTGAAAAPLTQAPALPPVAPAAPPTQPLTQIAQPTTPAVPSAAVAVPEGNPLQEAPAAVPPAVAPQVASLPLNQPAPQPPPAGGGRVVSLDQNLLNMLNQDNPFNLTMPQLQLPSHNVSALERYMDFGGRR